MKATQVVLRRYVESGEVTEGDFEVREVDVPESLGPEELLVEPVYLSVDPYMRGLMRDAKGYFLPPFALGQPVSSLGVGRVLRAGGGGGGLAEGDFVTGSLPWASVAVVSAAGGGGGGLSKVDTSQGLPLSYQLSALGMTSFTAYAPLKLYGRPKAGETLFVSGAAGAVGQAVGQIGKRLGLRVLGSAGSDAKAEMLVRQLGFDAAWNYRTADTADALARHAPDGIHIYYDNVGGPTLEAALGACAPHARVIACGAISQYDAPPGGGYGVKNLFLVVTKRLTIQGFIIGDIYAQHPELLGQFQADMGRWIKDGEVKVVEDIVPGGVAAAPAAFVGLMRGENVGKRMVACGPDPFRQQQ